MAQYWVYLNNEVAGPYEVEKLIRLRGFSRQTLVCANDSGGKPTHWISPAEIPELAHIFKAVDEHQTLAPAPAPPAPKVQPKVVAPRPTPKPVAPAVVLKKTTAFKVTGWVWCLLGIAIAAAIAYPAWQWMQKKTFSQEQLAAQTLVENERLAPTSLYSTLKQYIQEKTLHPRWEFERTQEGLYHVALSWYSQAGSSVYAFEVNNQAQTVRGINTAAIKLLSVGFESPTAAHPKPAPVKQKSPSDLFAGTWDTYRQAVEGGDFETVWNSFSTRKKEDMARGGMSHDGWIRLQNLTFKVDSAVKQTLLKSKDESEIEKLLLLKQSQAGRPDIFVKQVWTFKGNEWKLEDEEKRAAPPASSSSSSSPAATPSTPTAAPSPASQAPAPGGKPLPTALPGMSN